MIKGNLREEEEQKWFKTCRTGERKATKNLQLQNVYDDDDDVDAFTPYQFVCTLVLTSADCYFKILDSFDGLINLSYKLITD